MFDSKEIAQRALKRTEQISKQKKHRAQFALAAGVSTTACAAVIAISMAAAPKANNPEVTLPDNKLPLATFPVEPREFCPDCELELVDGICEVAVAPIKLAGALTKMPEKMLDKTMEAIDEITDDE